MCLTISAYPWIYSVAGTNGQVTIAAGRLVFGLHNHRLPGGNFGLCAAVQLSIVSRCLWIRGHCSQKFACLRWCTAGCLPAALVL